MSKDDWVIEMQEFARAAQVFQPVSGLIASRFTSSSSHLKAVSDEVESPSSSNSLLSKPAAKPEDPAEVAARMGMFGALTRSVQNFYPTRLLCKRLNVQPPSHVQLDPGDGPGEQSTSGPTAGGRFPTFSGHFSSGADNLLDYSESQRKGERDSAPNMADIATENLVVIDAARNDALEAERPGQAVFKAIFGSDDED